MHGYGSSARLYIPVHEVVRVVAAGEGAQAAVRSGEQQRARSLRVRPQKLSGGTGGHSHSARGDLGGRNSPLVVACDNDIAAQRRNRSHVVSPSAQCGHSNLHLRDISTGMAGCV